jgi:homoserine acetyltransferase
MSDYEIFEAGDVVLQSGLTYRGARLAYNTHGTLNAANSNVIVYPTSYGAQHPDLEWLIAPGKPLDPSKISSSSSTSSATGCHPRPATRRRRSTAAVIRISR